MAEEKLQIKGKIVKGLGGFYYVRPNTLLYDPSDNVECEYECRARGLFRKDGIKPLVGDDCVVEVISNEEKTGYVTEIINRKNRLLRPEVANVDQALIIMALSRPEPNFNLLDRLLVSIELSDVVPVIVFNKADTVSGENAEYCVNSYLPSGYEVICTCLSEGIGVDRIREIIKGKTTALCGPSGGGKSTLFNAVSPVKKSETGEVSEKIKRGKHTTRQSELICVDEGTFLFDTPGFSSIMIDSNIEAEDLRYYYPEFDGFEGSCRFNGCTHVSEPGCCREQMLEEGKISQLRYENYKALFDELKNRRKW